MTWTDGGPLGAGKILIDLLNGRTDDAKLKLMGWSRDDLVSLGRSAERLGYLARQEASRKDGS